MSKSLNPDDITVVHPDGATDTDSLLDHKHGFADDNNWWDSGRRDRGVDDNDNP